MTNIIYIDQSQAASMTTFNELVKMYTKRDPVKFASAIEKNKARYSSMMDEVLGRE